MYRGGFSVCDSKIHSKTTRINTAHGQSDDEKESLERDFNANMKRGQVKSRRENGLFNK